MLTTENFSKYYAFAIKYAVFDNSELWENTSGEWIKYNQGTSPDKLVELIEGYGTGWYTVGRSTAEEWLKSGDFLYILFWK